jgi:DNA-binding transcriptional LysR family regulator
MPLNLNSLRLFLAVATQGGFSRAARVAGVSQPAISKAVRLLEAQSGAQLLVRSPTGVTLTEAGRLLLEHARALFAEEQAAEERLDALRGLKGGVLRVGASGTLAGYVVPAILGRLYQLHPAIEIDLYSANARAIVGAVLEHRVELGLVEGPVRDGRVDVRPWREDVLVAVAAPSHPLAKTRPIPGQRLMKELMLLREEGSGTRDVTMAAFRRRHWVPDRTFEVNNTESIKGMVAAGMGWALLSRHTVRDELELGRLCELDVKDLNLRRTLSWVQLKTRRLGPAAAAFHALAQAAPMA